MNFVYDIALDDFKILHYLADWKPLDDSVVQRALDNSMLKISAHIDGKCVGIARIVGDYASHGLLCDVIVHPNYRGNGYGTLMINKLFDGLQQYVDENCDEFLLELLPAAGKEDFYKNCGMKYKPEDMIGIYKWFKNKKNSQDSKKHYFKLKDAPFNSIASGQKTIEMRLYDDKRQTIKSGDYIYFVHADDYARTLKVRVENIFRFKTFDELYANLAPSALGYADGEVANPNDMSQYYSADDIQKYGVCGIQIKLIK